jgi:nitrogen fixation/metabolism regulation signal transduction histidine kinase
MNIPDPQTTVREQDEVMRARILAEIRMLLRQRAELAQLEKVAAVREKTMRVAHDIRNPLAAIQAVCGSLIMETEDPGQRRRLEMISNQVDRLASALAGAVDGAREPDDEPVPIDLADLAQSLVNLLDYQTREDLGFRVRLGPNLACRLPQRGLTRSLYHLLRNAAEACAGRDSGKIVLDCRLDNPQLRIQVIDNGPGLPPDLLAGGLRAYATARPGRALGLCSVERFVNGLGGRLLLKNRQSGGACVTIVLPADCHVPVARAPGATDG